MQPVAWENKNPREFYFKENVDTIERLGQEEQFLANLAFSVLRMQNPGQVLEEHGVVVTARMIEEGLLVSPETRIGHMDETCS